MTYLLSLSAAPSVCACCSQLSALCVHTHPPLPLPSAAPCPPSPFSHPCHCAPPSVRMQLLCPFRPALLTHPCVHTGAPVTCPPTVHGACRRGSCCGGGGCGGVCRRGGCCGCVRGCYVTAGTFTRRESGDRSARTNKKARVLSTSYEE